MSDFNNWNTPYKKPRRGPAHPPGLKGKEIGMYYKYKYFNKQLPRKQKKDYSLNFTMPPSVALAVKKNIRNILKTAAEENITLPQLKKNYFYKEEMKIKSEPVKDEKFTKIFDEIKQHYVYSEGSHNNENSGSMQTNQDAPANTRNNVDESVTANLPIEQSVLAGDSPNEMKPFDDTSNEHDVKPNNIQLQVKSEPMDNGEDVTNNDFNLSKVKSEPIYDSSNESELKSNDFQLSKVKLEPVDETILQQDGNNLECEMVVKNLSEEHENSDTHTHSTQMISDAGLSEPSTSQAADNIAIQFEFAHPSTSAASFTTRFSTNQSETPQLGLRSSSTFKYGYHDIITGTFDEKLEKRLAKGIEITRTNPQATADNVAFYEEYKEMILRPNYKEMLKFRKTLPTFKKSEEILRAIAENQVVVISGETGCGKSTQVPQIILDDAVCNFRGANVKILVTEPRRIAASSLAMRVAKERDEKLGNSVGYAVRLERVAERSRASIQYCTTGILLTDLEVNQSVESYSHIILDEVHERDCHIDLAMFMLKKVLQKRKDLKVLLMSATIDSDSLCAYFDNCIKLHIEGLAYPVRDVYLEEVLQITKFHLEDNRHQRNNRLPKNKVYNKQNRLNKMDARDMQKDEEYLKEIGGWLQSMRHILDVNVIKSLRNRAVEDLNFDLIVCLLTHICNGAPGAVLIFLPGYSEIAKLLSFLNSKFHSSRYDIYPLHSKLPTADQHKIFERPLPHKRKIIIATNIAETSITVDDIVYVIDCGRHKVTGLNVERNYETLDIQYISKANLRQRRGRAGRCQPGICYHLLTSFRAETLADRTPPELQRSNLLEPVLSIKRLRLGLARDALRLVPSPPAESSVDWAVKQLQRCGALYEDEKLTPLGWHMARLPVHPAAGKLVILGTLFGCLDRAASIAAVWGFKDPFIMVLGKEVEIQAVKRGMCLGEPSDHIVVSEAIISWEQCSRSSQRDYCYTNFLSHNTLMLLSDMKKQLGANLRSMGFLPSGDIKAKWENRNSNNLSLFKAIIAASLYPNIGMAKWSGIKTKKRNPNIRIIARTPEDGRVCIHPSSVLYGGHGACNPISRSVTFHRQGANWLVYWLKRQSTNLFLFDVTLIYSLPLLFFGDFILTDNPEAKDECLLEVSTIKVRVTRDTADLLHDLRTLLDHVLASKVMSTSSHSIRTSKFEEQVLSTVIELITAEDEQAEYVTADLTDSDFSDNDFDDSYREF